MNNHGGELGLVHRFEPAESTEVADAATLLLLHGTGADENDLRPLGRALAPDANLLSPRGQVREHGAPRWFRRLAEGMFDVEDLMRRTHELADFVAAAAQTYGFDRRRIIAVGFSNGANIASSMLMLRPQELRAAVLLAPMVPLRPRTRVDLSETAVFIGAGRADPIASAREAEALASLLTEYGASVELHWHPGGHEVRPTTLSAAANWLRKLRAATATDPLP